MRCICSLFHWIALTNLRHSMLNLLIYNLYIYRHLIIVMWLYTYSVVWNSTTTPKNVRTTGIEYLYDQRQALHLRVAVISHSIRNFKLQIQYSVLSSVIRAWYCVHSACSIQILNLLSGRKITTRAKLGFWPPISKLKNTNSWNNISENTNSFIYIGIESINWVLPGSDYDFLRLEMSETAFMTHNRYVTSSLPCHTMPSCPYIKCYGML